VIRISITRIPKYSSHYTPRRRRRIRRRRNIGRRRQRWKAETGRGRVPIL